jgi:hypothetical protein
LSDDSRYNGFTPPLISSLQIQQNNGTFGLLDPQQLSTAEKSCSLSAASRCVDFSSLCVQAVVSP